MANFSLGWKVVTITWQIVARKKKKKNKITAQDQARFSGRAEIWFRLDFSFFFSPGPENDIAHFEKKLGWNFQPWQTGCKKLLLSEWKFLPGVKANLGDSQWFCLPENKITENEKTFQWNKGY